MTTLGKPAKNKLLFAGNCLIVILAGSIASYGHDAVTTKVTFDREIVRLMQSHCGSCHRPGGSSFSLMTYDDARPWAKAMGEEVLQRRMPPWGAVKGFGDFRNDKGLTPEQMGLIVDWEEGGAPEGDPKDIPAEFKYPEDTTVAGTATKEVKVSGDTKLTSSIVLESIEAKSVTDKADWQVIAEFPDGAIEPVIWFQNYKQDYSHPFQLRKPMTLPAGTMIRGVPASNSISFMARPAGKQVDLTGQLKR